MTVPTEKPPQTYEIQHLATRLGENEKLDKFVKGLCEEIKDVMDDRKKTLEPEWESCEENYWATGTRDDAGDRDSQLDFTISFEICKNAGSNLSNPVFAQDTIFVGKARPGYPMLGAAHDQLIDWIADRSLYTLIVNDSIRASQVYTKCVAKAGWSFDQRTVRYWDVDENGKSIEKTKTVIENEGCFPYLVDTRRIFHPIPSPSPEKARWIGELIDTTPAMIKKEKEKGYYRSDVEPMMVGDAPESPDEEVAKEEIYVALDASPSATKFEQSKVQLMETYTTFEGEEVVLILDVERGEWVSAHSAFFQDFPRPYATFAWHPTLASMDGKPLCAVLDQLHRAYRAIMNVLLDAGVRNVEPLLIALKRLKLSNYLDNGRLGPGLAEVEEATIDDLRKGIMEVRLAAGDPGFLITLLDRIVKHMHDASSIPPAFFGEELAERPTATGTTSIIEKAMQPLYELMTRFREYLGLIMQMQYARYRQFNPKSMQIFIQAQGDQELIQQTVDFPPGYWKDQVVIETKVNAQTMSKAVKKQEILAMVDKLPQIFEGAATMGAMAVEGTPMSPLAGSFLSLYDLVLKEFLTEFEMPEVRDALNIEGDKMAGEAISQTINQLTGIIKQLQDRLVDSESALVDVGIPVSEEPPAGMEQGGSQSPQAAA